ncbi:MAG: MoaD/ThiS family protein [Candidatus Bathyarchaeia archaeon]
MKVRVKFAGAAHKRFSLTDIWLFLHDYATVEDAFIKLKEQGVDIKPGDATITVLVNGRRIEFIGGLKTKLKDMDEIVLMPIIAGGL